jgi:ABC-2 type transport system ATP-binding protein
MTNQDKINILEIKNLNLNFKDNKIFSNINIEIKENSMVGIIGKSGSGKSTLLNCITGMLTPNNIELYYLGEKIQPEKLFQHIGFSFQHSSFYKDLTVKENMEFYGTMADMNKDSITNQTKSLLTTVGLIEHENKLAKQLSGGMQKRLDLAISLIHNPNIILLDEPMAGLDKDTREQIWKLLYALKNAGKTLIIVDHFIEELEQYADSFIELVGNGKAVVSDEVIRAGFWCIEITFNRELTEQESKRYNIYSKRIVFALKSKFEAKKYLNHLAESPIYGIILRVSMYQKK